MQEFSTLVYRGFGKHQRKGGGFDFAPALSQDELDALLKDGWYATLPEAIEAHDTPKPVEKTAEKAEEKLPEVQEDVKEPEDKSPPTRAELEMKARKLGIKFDGRTGNVKLLMMINEEIG